MLNNRDLIYEFYYLIDMGRSPEYVRIDVSYYGDGTPPMDFIMDQFFNRYPDFKEYEGSVKFLSMKIREKGLL